MLWAAACFLIGKKREGYLNMKIHLRILAIGTSALICSIPAFPVSASSIRICDGLESGYKYYTTECTAKIVSDPQGRCERAGGSEVWTTRFFSSVFYFNKNLPSKTKYEKFDQQIDNMSGPYGYTNSISSHCFDDRADAERDQKSFVK